MTKIAPTTEMQKDDLIDQLKNALVQRDMRIGQLELLLAKAQVAAGRLITPNIENVALPAPPPPASHPRSPLISAESKGLYPDGWMSPSAHLVFHPSAEASEYLVCFWLPNEVPAKSIVLTPNSEPQVELTLLPGKTIIYNLQIPPDAISPARLVVETSAIDAKPLDDNRALGAFLLRVVWAEHNREAAG